MNTVKTILKIIYNIIFAVLVISASFIVLTSFNIIKGYNFYVVMSGSMEPNIHTGSVVGVKEEEKYNIGDIITGTLQNNPNDTYTHRIVERNKEEKTYITKGDANESKDGDPLPYDSVLGKVFISIPLIGYVVNFAKQPTGFILMIGVPTVIIISMEINNIREGVKEIIENKKLNSKKEKSEE